jgi:hypothetical protein
MREDTLVTSRMTIRDQPRDQEEDKPQAHDR